MAVKIKEESLTAMIKSINYNSYISFSGSKEARHTPMNIPFYGLKSNLRIGDNVLREFKQNYPYLKSNTLIKTKIKSIADKKDYQHLLPQLRKICDKYGEGIVSVREKLLYSSDSFDEYAEKLSNEIKTNPFANCGEDAILIKKALTDRGEKAHTVHFDISTEFKNSIGMINCADSHAFNVFGLKKEADISNPKTWGNDAVIVDAWSNVVLSAKDGLEHFKKLFKVDSSCQHFIFSETTYKNQKRSIFIKLSKRK